MSKTYTIVSDQNNYNIVIDHLTMSGEETFKEHTTPKELNCKDFHKMYSFYKFIMNRESSARESILLLWSQS